MSRVVRVPALPATPGAWLACYRYRRKRPDGRPYSPEHLARDLAVSGDTVRRWEAGVSKPSVKDLLRFSEVCRLSDLEQAFLVEAFAFVEAESPPERATFQHCVNSILSEEFPAYIFDSLFNVRAWNTYIDLVHNYPFEPSGENMVARIFNDPDPAVAVVPSKRSREERAEWWLRSFWFQTARLCGSPAYVDTVGLLGRNPRFAQRWLSLGLDLEGAASSPIGEPTVLDAGRGAYRISTSSLVMPPTYFMREFAPIDERAWRELERRRRAGPPEIRFASRSHWATGAE